MTAQIARAGHDQYYVAGDCRVEPGLALVQAEAVLASPKQSSASAPGSPAEGIGDTIRVSLSAPPVEEVKVGIAILESLGMRQRGLEIVSCPSCAVPRVSPRGGCAPR